ncbi:MAG: DEAD/DEAH box helicase family protein, partial [Microbacteriaceae bacterium]
MWRADRHHLDDDYLSESDDGHVAAPHQVTAPHILSVGDPSFEPVNVAEPTWQAWRAELAGIGGRSPLLHFVDAPETRIELGATHPGGLARFIAGNATLLSSLIRDDLALRAAKLAAGNITAKGLELSTARGIACVNLGIGIAEWELDGVAFRAPVLLRPLGIRRYGRDFELKLRGAPQLNPELARALNEQFQIRLDADAFVALAETDGSFKPNPVIDRLRGLTSHLSWFNVQPRLVVSSFADVATAMHADAAHLSHPVLDALAGNPTARWGIIEGTVPIEPLEQDDRPPQLDILLLDADVEQEKVVAQIAAGNSLAVKTLPGAGGTQTIINALGCLVAQNKRVLVVSPRRDSLRGIAARLNEIGLPGFAVTPDTLRRDLIRSIARNEKAKPAKIAEVDEALLRLRKVLLDYRIAMTRRDGSFGVSVLDCLTELSRLALLPNPPATTSRLSRESVEALAVNRSRAADIMVQAANLGEFKYGPEDSPWYGAAFLTSESAGQAHQLAKRLHTVELPRLLEQAGKLIDGTGMRAFDSITELGVYLRLLTDIRDTLDRFLPVVFDRSLGELIAATAPRKDHRDMSRLNRRRLRKLAREYVRPGVHITDMNESLTRIQQQRVLWQRFVAGGVTPQVPVGIADVQVAYQQVIQDLSYLDIPLGAVTREAQLASMPIRRLLETVKALAADSDVLANLQERAELMTMLRSLQVDPLIADLAMRHVGPDGVAAELELAWWQSVLESLLHSDRALLNANTSMLDRLEADFRLVDEAHSAGNAMQLAWQLAENWQIGLVDWPDEAVELKRALRLDRIHSEQLQQIAPHLSRSIAPVWLASPYEVPKITDQMAFDTVI